MSALVPGPATAAWAAGAGLVAALAWGRIAGGLRRRRVRVAYTRKVFHVGIFTTAAAVHLLGSLPATNAFGASVAAVVLAAVVQGPGHPLYDGLARPADAPHGALFIVVPLGTTAVGGLLAAVLFGPLAAVGYLVAGWGDAVGEPVGARFGRHRYRVPSLAGVVATRSWEGSASVVAVSALAAWTALTALGWPSGPRLVAAVAAALLTGAVEALSPHGTDNLTVPVAATWVVWALA